MRAEAKTVTNRAFKISLPCSADKRSENKSPSNTMINQSLKKILSNTVTGSCSKCEDFPLVFVLYDCKLNVFGFWNIGWTKTFMGSWKL